jgi:DNA-binding transcriptional regulator GbsR (MarR family)
MKKNNTFSRIHKIYDILDRGGFFSAQEISEITGEPKGTISPLLSALVSTKNIVNDRGNGYKSEYFHKDLKQIAQDVAKHEKNRREIIQGKRKAKLKKLQNIVDQVANEMPAQLSIDVEKNFKDIAEKVKNENWDFERVDSFHIDEAVKMLKSKGYKILAPVTEFKEI